MTFDYLRLERRPPRLRKEVVMNTSPRLGRDRSTCRRAAQTVPLVITLALALVSRLAVEASAQTCTPPPSGLVAWWSADGTANDIAGTNTGTLQNGATFGSGKVDQAFSLDGVDDYVGIANGPSLDMGTGDC